MFISSSPSVPTRRRVVEEIGSTTPLGKRKENIETEKGIEDPKIGQGTKKRKASIASKQLPIFEESGEVASTAVGAKSLSKEVSHPPIPKGRYF